FVIVPNDTFDSETANVYELGYRAQPTQSLSYSVTLFQSDYDRLRSVEFKPGGAVFANGIEGRSTGVEAWGSWRVTPAWLLAAGVAATRERWHVKPDLVDFGALSALGNDPATQWMARMDIDLSPQHTLNIAVR